MLMPKDPASLENFTSDFNKGEPYVMFPGTEYAHLMIPIEGYYKYQESVSKNLNLHIRVVWPTHTLRSYPNYVLAWIFNIASLAVNTVLSI